MTRYVGFNIYGFPGYRFIDERENEGEKEKTTLNNNLTVVYRRGPDFRILFFSLCRFNQIINYLIYIKYQHYLLILSVYTFRFLLALHRMP